MLQYNKDKSVKFVEILEKNILSEVKKLSLKDTEDLEFIIQQIITKITKVTV